LRGTWNITLGEQPEPCISLSLSPLFAFGFSHPPNVQFTTIPVVFGDAPFTRAYADAPFAKPSISAIAGVEL
jgi:hypothetical protein